MYIKSVKLKNFKQFIDEEIEFHTSKEKPLVLIEGCNASGKTTIMEAIRWCFGGTLTIHGTILNRKVYNQLAINGEINVEVEVVFINEDKEYTMKKTQKLKKVETTSSKEIIQNVSQPEIQVSYVNADNNIHIVEHVSTITDIIPFAISDLMFINSDILQEISKNIYDRESVNYLKDTIKEKFNLKIIENHITNLQLATKKLRFTLNKDESDNETLKCIETIQQVLNQLSKKLYDKQNDIIETLVSNINEFCSKIFPNQIKVQINSSYIIKTVDYNNDESRFLGNSQILCIALASIVALLNLIKRNTENKDCLYDYDNSLKVAKTPLILDSPFCVFSMEVVEKICSVIPNISEQIIILAKNPETDLIKELLKDYISDYALINIAENIDDTIDTLESSIEVKNLV